MAHTYNDNDYQFSNPPNFDGDKIEFWKGIIESFFLSLDVDLYDMVSNVYEHPFRC